MQAYHSQEHSHQQQEEGALVYISSARSGPTTQPAPLLGPSTSTPVVSLSSRGPYNPAAVLPPKVAKKILEFDFVEMSEITLDDPPPHAPSQPSLPARPPIHYISVWIEKFSVMAALISARFPDKAPELFAYQASIVTAERNFDDRRWVAYDRCYRREALAQTNLDWSAPNAWLYNEAFTAPGQCLAAQSAFRRTIHHNSAHGTQTAHGLGGLFPRPHPQQNSLNHRSAPVATTMAGISKPPTRAGTRTDAPTAVGPTLGLTVPEGGIGATMLDHGPPLARTVRRAARPALQHQATSTVERRITLPPAQPLTTPCCSTDTHLYISLSMATCYVSSPVHSLS